MTIRTLLISITFISLISSQISCQSKNEKIDIFYFTHYFTTTVSVTCNSMFHIYDLHKITIDDENEIIKLKQLVSELKIDNSFKHIDVRRQVVVDNKRICFDNFKRAIHNNKGQDSIASALLYDYISNLIVKYDKNAILYNPQPIIEIDSLTN